ncbi:unnamed protein product [Moneuplotes crassus]|uniref:Uncharacterized protein n=1 Tax=Euplotes crassus TaxID=5936 RepID=A0AAD1U2T8_EUPCR|nr:unnamed protein product [Moneuplotes crassus]
MSIRATCTVQNCRNKAKHYLAETHQYICDDHTPKEFIDNGNNRITGSKEAQFKCQEAINFLLNVKRCCKDELAGFEEELETGLNSLKFFYLSIYTAIRSSQHFSYQPIWDKANQVLEKFKVFCNLDLTENFMQTDDCANSDYFEFMSNVKSIYNYELIRDWQGLDLPGLSSKKPAALRGPKNYIRVSEHIIKNGNSECEDKSLHEESKTLEAQNCQFSTTSLSSIASEGSEPGLSEDGDISYLINNHPRGARHMEEDKSSDCIYMRVN